MNDLYKTMEATPKFSVVIPLYNKAASVGATLQTVFEQTFTDFEIVVVDDGSTDGSADIVASLKHPKVRLIRQANSGVSAARNRGIREARAPWIAFLDADDLWTPRHLADIAAETAAHPECGMVATRYDLFDEFGNHTPNAVNGVDLEKLAVTVTDYFHLCSISDPLVWSSAVAVRRDLLSECGGFPVGVTSGEDLVTWAHLACLAPLRFVTTVSASYYKPKLTPATGIVPPDLKSSRDFVGSRLEELHQRYPDKGIGEYIAFWYKMRAAINVRLGARAAAFRLSAKSIRFRPLKPKPWIILCLASAPRAVTRLVMGTTGSPQENLLNRLRMRLGKKA